MDIKVKDEPTVVLTLTMAEARVLYASTDEATLRDDRPHIAGDLDGEAAEKMLDKLQDMLYNAIEPYVVDETD